MTNYVRIPIRADEHQRLTQLQNTLAGKIESYLSRPSLSDVIKYLLDQQEIKTMNINPSPRELQSPYIDVFRYTRDAQNHQFHALDLLTAGRGDLAEAEAKEFHNLAAWIRKSPIDPNDRDEALEFIADYERELAKHNL